MYVETRDSRDTRRDVRCETPLIMQLSHLSRFDHDWYRGAHRGPIGTIVSNLIRSYHILMSIVTIGLIVENFLAAKNFATITRIGGTIVTIASDRMIS